MTGERRRAWNSTLPAPTAPMSRSSRIRQVSPKRQRENRERRAMVNETFGTEPLCSVWQARLTIGLPPLKDCTRWAWDANEITRRSQGGPITDPANINTPCRPCHDVLTFTPASQLGWARKLGLVKSAKWGGEAA